MPDLPWILGDTRHNVREPLEEGAKTTRGGGGREGKGTQESEASGGREELAVFGTSDRRLKGTLEDANLNPTSKILQPPPVSLMRFIQRQDLRCFVNVIV